MIKYVLGFLFDPNGCRVALIKKESPAWQAGKFNAIGGKVREGESPNAAMTREFLEETGIYIDEWKCLGIMGTKDSWEVNLFAAASEKVLEAKTTTEEEVLVFTLKEALELEPKDSIRSLTWLINLAHDMLFYSNSPVEVNIEY